MSDSDHASMVGPEAGHKQKSEIRVNDEWARSLYVDAWPKRLDPGVLDKLYTAPSENIDTTIHQTPIPRTRSISNVKDAIRDLKGAIKDQASRDSANLKDTKRRLAEHEALKERLENGDVQMHDVGVYVTIRAETRSALDSIENEVTNELTPHQVRFKRVRYAQDEGVATTSPLAVDRVEKTTRMPSDALASLYPFSATTILEESGVLLGYHATTDAPVMVDRFARDNGYHVIISGETGDGKSFGSKLMLLRRRVNDPETLIFIVDPLSDFTRFVDQMEGENIPIGGKRGLNPMDIKPTPQRILDRNPDYDPFAQNLSGLRGFLDDFFARQGFEFNVGETVLDIAIDEAYERAGITPDPSTHHNESPTIRHVDDDIPNVRDILGEINANAAAVDPDIDDSDTDRYEEAASELRMALLPFEAGKTYGHLGGRNDITLNHDSHVVNLDMHQSEQTGDIGLMMTQALNSIYELAKTTPKKVILAIDEAHLLLDNQSSLDWLTRVTRHGRHHDLSLHLATQNLEDFTSSKQRRSILGNCSVGLHWKEDPIPEGVPDALDLTSREADFLNKALPGSWERGFSQCLLRVDDQAYPVKVTPLKDEATMIDEDLAKRFGVA